MKSGNLTKKHKIIDLHIHSNFSDDADHSVKELFKLTQKAGISAISVTDHDSIQSISAAEGLSNHFPFEYIPGVELTTVFDTDKSQQHILGYYIDEKNPVLLTAIEKISDFRNKIGAKRIQILKELGFYLNESAIWKRAGDRPPTPVSILIELFENVNNQNDPRLYDYLKGKKKDQRITQFYRDYLIKDKPAYVEFESISSDEAVNIIKKAGGIPILAHPVNLDRKWLDTMKESGIAGLEAVSTYHNEEQIKFYLNYAEKKNLLITAGSDFHGSTAKPHIRLGEQKDMDYKYYEKLIEFMK